MRWPVHPVLCTSLFVLLWYRDGRAHIELARALGYLVLCCVATALLQGALQFATRRPAAAAVVITLVLCVFWLFTPICLYLHVGLDTVGLAGWLRVRHFLALLLAGAFGCTWCQRDRLQTISRHLDVTFLLLVLVTLVQVAMAKGPAGPLRLPPPRVVATDRKVSRRPPDIYWIIFDAYTSIHQLRTRWHYPPTDFLKEIEALGMTVREDAESNYNQTLPSVASVLDLDYVPLPEGLTYPQQLVFLRRLIGQSTLVNTLRQHDYEVVNLSFLDLPAAKREYDFPYFTAVPSVEDLLRRTPLQYRLPPPPDLEIRLFERLQQLMRNHHKSTKPRFVYAHLLLPHSPYRYDEEGRLVDQAIWDAGDMAGYLRQVKFAEKLVRSLAAEARASYPADAQPVLVILGDHGFRLLRGEAQEDESFSCFLAVSLPGVPDEKLQQVSTPMNVFRLMLDEYFGSRLPLLEIAQYNHTVSGLKRRSPSSATNAPSTR